MEDIAEALEVIKNWNPMWSPKFFMSDYSEAEMSAVQNAFPDIRCTFVTFTGNNPGRGG